MGAINYSTDDYITLAMPLNYMSDDEYDYMYKRMYDYVENALNDCEFYYFKVTIKPGYYEGFQIRIEDDFPYALDSWENRRDANKEITTIKHFLLECVKIGMRQCFPGWCTGWSDRAETIDAIKAAARDMRAYANSIPTWTQYERGYAN